MAIRKIRQIGRISIDTTANGVSGTVLRLEIDGNRQIHVVVDGREVSIEPEMWQEEEKDRWQW